MRFITSAPAILAMVTAAVAQTADFNPIYAPSDSQEVCAGSEFEVIWDAPEKYADDTVSIHLIGGADQNTLVPIADIASNILNSVESYIWSVDASLGSENIYGLIFRLERDTEIFQYSQPFQIVDCGDGGDGDHEPTTSEVTTSDTMVVTASEVTVSDTMVVTVTSCPPTETTETHIATSTFAPNTTHIETHSSIWVTSSVVISETHYPNNTSTYVAPTLPPVVEPPVTTSELPEVPPPSSTPSDIPGSAARFGSGVLAVAGGLAIAILL